MLLFNLINTEQKQVIYAKYGLDWQWVRDAVKETFSDDDRRDQLKESTNIFRVLIKTLLHAGIITQRTAPLYAVWVDMKELEAEGEGIPGDIVAEEMLVVLREINAKRKRISSRTWRRRRLDGARQLDQAWLWRISGYHATHLCNLLARLRVRARHSMPAISAISESFIILHRLCRLKLPKRIADLWQSGPTAPGVDDMGRP